MALTLTAEQKRQLLSQPESGMGYQVVEAQFLGGRVEKGMAYNAQLLVLTSEPQVLITRESYDRLLTLSKSAGDQIKSLRVLARSQVLALSTTARESTVQKAKGPPAIEAPEEKTRDGEVFKRFVAYSNDVRLTADKAWSPGTYATTEEDAKNVKTGEEAVKRYALPNTTPASYVFTGKPAKDTKIQRGIVEIANNQPGGGVEVYFKDGTNANSVTGPEKIPDK